MVTNFLIIGKTRYRLNRYYLRCPKCVILYEGVSPRLNVTTSSSSLWIGAAERQNIILQVKDYSRARLVFTNHGDPTCIHARWIHAEIPTSEQSGHCRCVRVARAKLYSILFSSLFFLEFRWNNGNFKISLFLSAINIVFVNFNLISGSFNVGFILGKNKRQVRMRLKSYKVELVSIVLTKNVSCRLYISLRKIWKVKKISQ